MPTKTKTTKKAAKTAKPEKGWYDRPTMAAMLGVSLQHFDRHYRPIAPESDVKRTGGRLWVRARALIDAIVAGEVERVRADVVEDASDDPLMAGTGSGSPNLERYRSARADEAELRVQDLRFDTLRRGEVLAAMQRGIATLRATGERLGQKFGNDAVLLFSEGLEAFAHAGKMALADPREKQHTADGVANESDQPEIEITPAEPAGD